jgi:glycosyltransferase involved in cell wall biosynthesis
MRLLLFNLATDAEDSILGFTTRWIQVLAEKIAAIDVITMRAGKIELPKNVQVYSVGKEKGYSEFRRALEFYRILGTLLRHEHYDCCFAHMMPLFAVMAAPLFKLRRIPTVLWYTHKSVTMTLRLATRLVDRIVTASPESFRIPSPKVRVIGHGIDTEEFIPAKNRLTDQWTFKILTVSRLSPIKRIDLILEAVALLLHRQPELPIVFTIVGAALSETDRRYVAQLQRQIQETHLQEVVRFVGAIPFQEVVPYYQDADCFINLSETGAVDKAVLEAMSCGVVVLVNPIFANLLGAELAQTCIVPWNAEQLCVHLQRVATMPQAARDVLGKQLRAIVIHDHHLGGLCQKLLTEFRAVAP